MLEMLPTPWGLVRSGVAPDHPKIKSISAQFEKTALDPRFRFFGNIVVGEHVQTGRTGRALRRGDLRVGAQSDRPLNIPGEDLPGSVAAVDFVGWYNAHPHFEEMAPDLSHRRGRRGRQRQRRAGRGAHPGHRSRRAGHHRHRRPRAEDPCTPAASRRWSIIGRRGPLQAPFTTLELRELGRPRGARRRRRGRRPGRLRRHHRRGPRGRGQDRQAKHQGVARLRRHGAERGQAPDRVPVPHVADRDQGRRQGRVDRVGPQRTGHRRQAAGWSPRTPASARSCPRSWWSARSATAGWPRRACRSTTGTAPFRTPTAGSTAAATSTSSAGSSAARRA